MFFVVQKPSGKYRLILNLKPLKQSVSYKRFRMESIFTVRALLPRNCYMAYIDLKDAYLHVPITKVFQKFPHLAANVGETIHLQFQALLFHQSLSPCFLEGHGRGHGFSAAQSGLDDLLLWNS